MLSRLEGAAAIIGTVLVIAGIASYSWRSAVITTGVLLLLAVVSRRNTHDMR